MSSDSLTMTIPEINVHAETRVSGGKINMTRILCATARKNTPSGVDM